jgi:hypothetical protein
MPLTLAHTLPRPSGISIVCTFIKFFPFLQTYFEGSSINMIHPTLFGTFLRDPTVLVFHELLHQVAERVQVVCELVVCVLCPLLKPLKQVCRRDILPLPPVTQDLQCQTREESRVEGCKRFSALPVVVCLRSARLEVGDVFDVPFHEALV